MLGIASGWPWVIGGLVGLLVMILFVRGKMVNRQKKRLPSIDEPLLRGWPPWVHALEVMFLAMAVGGVLRLFGIV